MLLSFSGAGAVMGAMVVAWLGHFPHMGLTTLLVQACFGVLLAPAITGLITDDEWRARIAQELQRVYPLSAAAAAVQQWSASTGDVDHDTLALLDQCHAHLRVVLVTNATSRLPRDLAALGIAERFHAVVNSSEIGFAKPASAFYRVVLERAGVAAEHALFIDDSIANVQAATALGMQGHHFTGHHEMQAFLHSVGVHGGDTH